MNLSFTIRKAKPHDAQSIVDLITQLDCETNFMLFEPGERKPTVAQQEAFLQELETSSAKIMLVAESETKLAGFIVGIGGIANRNRHTCSIVIGVLKAYWGLGIATELWANFQIWANNHSMPRLELTVMAHNQRAIAFYEKCGFIKEGVRRNSIKIDRQFIDELFMARLI